MRGYNQKIPPDTWGSEIIGRYKKNPKGLIEQLLQNRKITVSEYIVISELLSIAKILNSLIRDTKELLKKLNSRTQVGSG